MKILTLVLWLLVVWRMVWVLKWKWYWKVLLIAFAGMGAFKFQIFRIIGGHYFSPDLPDFIIVNFLNIRKLCLHQNIVSILL